MAVVQEKVGTTWSDIGICSYKLTKEGAEMYLPLVSEDRRGMGVATFLILSLKQRVAEQGKTLIITKIPPNWRGYEEFIFKNGFF